MERKWIVTGLLLLIVGIILGAFGAHSLKNFTSDQNILKAFDTAVDYQTMHGLGFLIVPFILRHFSIQNSWIYRFLLLGVLLFSGSIFMLTISKLADIELMRKIAGPITPLGGLFMILGWSILLISILKLPKKMQA